MSIVKTKARNKMLMSMLVAIMRIRIHMRVFNVCCTNYEITDHMFSLFNNSIYEKSYVNEDNNETEDLILTETISLIENN